MRKVEWVVPTHYFANIMDNDITVSVFELSVNLSKVLWKYVYLSYTLHSVSRTAKFGNISSSLDSWGVLFIHFMVTKLFSHEAKDMQREL